MQEEEFRYYRWRTLYGSKLWSLDAGFYELLGSLHLQDLAPRGPDVFSRADVLRSVMTMNGVITDPTVLIDRGVARRMGFVVDEATPPEEQGVPS